MTERERLIELFMNFSFKCIEPCGKQIKRCGNKITIQCEKCRNEQIADYLLKNGVIVPPCKVGDFVYIDNRCIFTEFTNGYTGYSTCEVISIVRTRKQKLMKIAPVNAQWQNSRYNLRIPFSAIGKTVFLTKEEAEQALKGGGKE